MKTHGPISVDLREKFLSLLFSFLPCTLPLCSFLVFRFILFFPFFFLIWIHGSHCAMCPSLIRICFFPETIYIFSIQFILNEISSSHFLTSEIFVKISSLESLATYHPENRRNIPTVSEFDETFMGHWISQDESNGAVRFIIRDLENFLGFPEPFLQIIIIIIIIITIFPFFKIYNFPEFYNPSSIICTS